MQIIKVKADIKDGCDKCIYNVEGEPCKFPGRPACGIEGIIYKAIGAGIGKVNE